MQKNPVYVTKSFLPPLQEYESYVKKIWTSGQLTNQGPLLKEFENKIKEFLDVDDFHFLSNGTISLQIAINALGIREGEIVTTPFSYVATVSSILWERCSPVFVDIDTRNYNIDVSLIEKAITKDTKAILAVHVFGIPCNIEEIARIAKKHNLKVIYDGAHAFGVKTEEDLSLLSFGDISTCSFHATKLFHTIEGGGVVVNDVTVSEKVELMKRFGHDGDDHKILGINAKANEFQAAMGLSNLKYIDFVISERKNISEKYDSLIKVNLNVIKHENYKYNYCYYPILLESNDRAISIKNELEKNNIYARRYFYPSLNTVPYVGNNQKCPNSEDISSRILCLPLYPGLKTETVLSICEIVNNAQ